jgi:hypothetical protein
MPKIPDTRAAGKENITSNPPRIARGLPQPGWHRNKRKNVAPAIINSMADIFPKRIYFVLLVIV